MRHFAKQLFAVILLLVPALSYAQNNREMNHLMRPGEGLTASQDSILSKRTKSQEKKGETLDVYMFAAAFSMIDSIMVISDIQKLDQVSIHNRWFLTDRREYENQFGTYVSENYGMTVLPFVTFSPKEKEVLKQREKLIRKGKKKQQFKLTYSGSSFKFSEPERYKIH